VSSLSAVSCPSLFCGSSPDARSRWSKMAAKNVKQGVYVERIDDIPLRASTFSDFFHSVDA
jgi:hypothetical protein